MEQLRKIFKRLRGSPEKVVFAVVVMVLIWRVVQIVVVLPRGGDDRPPPPPVAVSTEEAPGMNQLPDQPVSKYADISVGRWDLLGGPVSNGDGESEDPDLPEIQLEGIEEVRGTYYATISVDGRAGQRIRKGQSFAKRKAVLDEIDAEARKVMFTWRPTNRKYERTMTG